MANYAMVINIDKCNGCYNCFLSCKDEYSGNDYPPLSLALPEAAKPWMVVREVERGRCPKVKVDYVPIPCQQCAHPACIEKSPQGAVYMRPDGIVMIDPEKAKGRREVVNACPHRLITWNEEKEVPQKCTFCAHLLDQGWKAPRCVTACPSGALIFGDLDDPESEVSKLGAKANVEPLSPTFNLAPKVLYRSLPKKMITGEVVLSDRQDTCAADVMVTLNGDSVTQMVKTNFMGDFEFDGLDGNAAFTLSISHAGYADREILVKTNTDVNVGEILLEPKSSH
jgi:Fe-S-cluster-containing dehydrogenase component